MTLVERLRERAAGWAWGRDDLLREAADALDAPLVLTDEEREFITEGVEYAGKIASDTIRVPEIMAALREGGGIR